MSGHDPENEADRLAALKRYDLLDTPQEAVFDGITRLLAQQLDVPIALVSLVDETRQWFKSRFGVEASETPREFAFCAHAIQGDDIMVVEDATRDSRFATSPLVTGQPGVRFYAGALLRTEDGYNLGTLSAVDVIPRTLPDDQRRVLEELSRIVVDVMELRRVAKSAVVSERSVADSAELRSLDMQKALRTSEARFASILDIAHDAIVSVDERQRICLFNQGAEATFGYAAEEILGEQLDILIPPRFRSRHRGHMKAFSLSAEASRDMNRRGEVVGLRKDGTEFPAIASVSKLALDNGTIFTVMLRDVTDRVVMENALRENEARFRDFAGAASDSFWEHNEKLESTHSTLMKNPAHTSEKDLIGKTRWRLAGADADRDPYWRQHREALEAHRPFRDFEYSLRDAQGKLRHLSASGVPVFDADGNFKGYRGSARDVTERVNAAAIVQERESLLRNIIDEMPALISLKGADGRYVLANRRFAEINELDVDTIVGKTSFDVGMSDEDARALVALDRKVLETGDVQVVERKFETLSGPYDRYVRKFPVYDSNGAISGIGTVSVDLSDRKAIEEQLRQAQKLEAVGQLTGGIAHDFNNLLGIIVGNLGLLKDTLPREGEQREFVEESLQAARQGAELTNRLLAYSRKQPLRPVVVDLNEAVHGIIDLLRRTLGETIAVRTVAPANLGKTEIDPGQLEAALLNLAVNARHAMPAGGQLTIKTENFEVGPNSTLQELAPGRYVTLSVSDTGTGMSPEILERVFEPFFTTKGVGEGSGLGLSMVFGFVKQSGGHISIDSVEDEGTTVRLYFPESETANPPLAEHPTTENVPRGVGETVLVVEDDDRLRAVAVRIFDRPGLQHADGSRWAGRARVARRGGACRCAFTDIVLARGMNGITLAKAARTRRSGLRVLYTSGYANEVDSDCDSGETDLDLLDKPYSRDDLARRLRQVLDRN